MIANCVEGTDGAANGNGWQTEFSFLKILKHFHLHAKPTKEQPVLLLMDDHSSHEGFVEVKFAKDNSILF